MYPIFIYLQTLTLLIGFLLSQTCLGRAESGFTVPNMGVSFTPVASGVYPSTSFQDVVLNIRVPRFETPNSVPMVEICYNGSTTWELMVFNKCRFMELNINRGVSMFNDLLPLLNASMRTVEEMLAEINIESLNTTSERHRRAILGFLGDLISAPLGLATSADLQDLINHVKNLKLTQGDVLQDVKQTKEFVTKVISSTNEGFNVTWSALNKVRNDIDNLAEFAKKTARKDLVAINRLAHSEELWLQASSLSIKLSNLLAGWNTNYEIVKQWEMAIMSVLENKLSPFLVPVDMLTYELQQLEESESIIRAGLNVLHTSRQANYYYMHKLATPLFHKGRLFVHFKVPLGSRGDSLQVFHAKTYNLPFHPVEKDNALVYEGYSRLFLDNPFIAVSKSGQNYLQLSEADVQICLASPHFSCNQLAALNDHSQMTCIYALYKNLVDEIKARCNYRFFSDTPNTEIKMLPDNKFLVIAPSEPVLVDCESSRKRIKPEPLILLEIPCACSISAGPVFVQRVMLNCKSIHLIQSNNVINSIQLLSYNMNLDGKLGNGLSEFYNDTLVITGPQTNELSTFLAMQDKDRERGYDLFLAAKRMAEHQVVMSDTAISDVQGAFDDISMGEAALFGVTGVWLIVLTIALIISGYYVKVLYLIMSNVHNAEALKLVSATTSAMNVESHSTEGNNYINMDHGTFLVKIFFICILMVIAFRIYKCLQVLISYKFSICEACHFKVIMMAFGKQQTINIPVIRVPLPLSCVEINAIPTPHVFELVGGFQPKLLISWESPLELRCYEQSFSFPMPREVNISWVQFSKLKLLQGRNGHSDMLFAIRLIKGCLCCPTISKEMSSTAPLNKIEVATDAQNMPDNIVSNDGSYIMGAIAVSSQTELSALQELRRS